MTWSTSPILSKLLEAQSFEEAPQWEDQYLAERVTRAFLNCLFSALQSIGLRDLSNKFNRITLRSFHQLTKTFSLMHQLSLKFKNADLKCNHNEVLPIVMTDHRPLAYPNLDPLILKWSPCKSCLILIIAACLRNTQKKTIIEEAVASLNGATLR